MRQPSKTIEVCPGFGRKLPVGGDLCAAPETKAESVSQHAAAGCGFSARVHLQPCRLPGLTSLAGAWHLKHRPLSEPSAFRAQNEPSIDTHQAGAVGKLWQCVARGHQWRERVRTPPGHSLWSVHAHRPRTECSLSDWELAPAISRSERKSRGSQMLQ